MEGMFIIGTGKVDECRGIVLPENWRKGNGNDSVVYFYNCEWECLCLARFTEREGVTVKGMKVSDLEKVTVDPDGKLIIPEVFYGKIGEPTMVDFSLCGDDSGVLLVVPASDDA